jgi:hypothetical protein
MAGVAFGLCALIALVVADEPPAAYACSGEPLDPNQATVIAEGWVERVSPRADLPSGFPVDPKNPKLSADPFVPVEVSLRVERFLKGGAPSPLTFVDPRSVPRAQDGSALRRPDGAIQFAGASGACGILDGDPTGKYALIVFTQGTDSRLAVNQTYGAAFDVGPDGPRVRALREHVLQRLRPTILPRAGEGGSGGGAGASAPPTPADTPYERRNAVVLIAESDFGVGFVRKEVLLMTLLERFFTLRSDRRGQSAGDVRVEAGKSPMQAVMDAPGRELTPAALAGVDVLVLPNWSVTTVGGPGGTRHLSNNLSETEIATLADWVGAGGRLLVIARPVGRADENNVPTLLARFGLSFDHGSGRLSEQPVAAHGRIGRSDYTLLLPTWTWSVAGGEPVATARDRTVATVAKSGQGLVAFLGNGQIVEHASVLRRPPFAGFDLGENMLFLVDLINVLADRPPLSAAERQHLGWDVKLMALSATLAETDVMNYRPRSPQGSDFAGARGLLAAAERGQRCDLGPGCVPFTIDQAAREDLERAAALTDQALVMLGEAEAALDRRDYPAVERAYQATLAEAQQALAAARAVRDRYDPIGRAYYEHRALNANLPALLVGGLTVVAIGAGVFRWRRRTSRLGEQ